MIHKGLNIKLSSLKVGGLSLNSQDKTFRRPEGRYQVIARTEDYPKLTSQLLVSPAKLTAVNKHNLNYISKTHHQYQ